MSHSCNCTDTRTLTTDFAFPRYAACLFLPFILASVIFSPGARQRNANSRSSEKSSSSNARSTECWRRRSLPRSSGRFGRWWKPRRDAAVIRDLLASFWATRRGLHSRLGLVSSDLNLFLPAFRTVSATLVMTRIMTWLESELFAYLTWLDSTWLSLCIDTTCTRDIL